MNVSGADVAPLFVLNARLPLYENEDDFDAGLDEWE